MQNVENELFVHFALVTLNCSPLDVLDISEIAVDIIEFWQYFTIG